MSLIANLDLKSKNSTFFFCDGIFVQSDWEFQLELLSFSDLPALTEHLKNIPLNQVNIDSAIFLRKHLESFI